MTRRVGILILIIIGLTAAWGPARPAPEPEPGPRTEYEVKIAMLYNFLKFTEWENAEKRSVAKGEDTGSSGDEKSGPTAVEPLDLEVGILADERNFRQCRAIDGKKVRHWTLRPTRLTPKDLELLAKEPDAERFARLRVLYLTEEACRSAKLNMVRLLKALKGRRLIIVTESQGCLEQGAIYNFLPLHKSRIKFEINLKAAKAEGMKIKTSLLKLAVRVIKK